MRRSGRRYGAWPPTPRRIRPYRPVPYPRTRRASYGPPCSVPPLWGEPTGPDQPWRPELRCDASRLAPSRRGPLTDDECATDPDGTHRRRHSSGTAVEQFESEAEVRAMAPATWWR